MYAASACGERRRLRGGTCERRMLRNARRSSGSSGHASGGRCRSVASGAVERVGASEASRGEAEPLRKRVTAQRGNERRGTSRFVGCGMGERGGEARPHHGGVRGWGGSLLAPRTSRVSRPKNVKKRDNINVKKSAAPFPLRSAKTDQLEQLNSEQLLAPSLVSASTYRRTTAWI